MQRCEVCGDPSPRRPCLRCGGRIARDELLAPAPGGALAELVNGLRLALRGAVLTLRTPRLLALVVLPLLITVALFAALATLIVEYRDLMRPELATAWPWGLDRLRGFVAAAAQWLGVLAAIGVAAVSTILLSQVVNAPFLEWLSQAVESIVVGQPDATPLTLARLWRTGVLPILQAAGMAIVQAAFGLLFLLLSLLAVTAPIAAVGGVWLVALTLADVAIARKGFPVRERFRRVRRSLPLYLGLALPFFLAPFLLPLGVAGATLAELRERCAERPRRDAA
ncbi:MAG: EI24 domain-containing protein [Thermodesulfobacteriota bacterium]